jgi:hypothetical protein
MEQRASWAGNRSSASQEILWNFISITAAVEQEPWKSLRDVALGMSLTINGIHSGVLLFPSENNLLSHKSYHARSEFQAFQACSAVKIATSVHGQSLCHLLTWLASLLQRVFGLFYSGAIAVGPCLSSQR